MPVRIYDISKKLGLENKEVLTKAKELGIAAARVASSSLDKITAEYLEQQLVLAFPGRTAPPPPPAPTPAPASQLAGAVAPPPQAPPAVQAQGTVNASAPAVQASESQLAATPVPIELKPLTESRPAAEPIAHTAPPGAPPPPAVPPPPPPPLGPKLGDKVGFIQLPTKPVPKPVDKPGAVKLPTRPPEQTRTEFYRRGDIRSVRGAGAPASPAVGGAKLSPGQKGGKAPEPAAPKLALPSDAQVITIKPPIVVRELAEQLKQKPFKIIADLMEAGVFANVNQAIDETVAERVCAKYGFRF